jgi:hypothetical protein
MIILVFDTLFIAHMGFFKPSGTMVGFYELYMGFARLYLYRIGSNQHDRLFSSGKLSPHSERDSIMTCAIKCSFKTGFPDLSPEICHVNSHTSPDKTGFHASN